MNPQENNSELRQMVTQNTNDACIDKSENNEFDFKSRFTQLKDGEQIESGKIYLMSEEEAKVNWSHLCGDIPLILPMNLDNIHHLEIEDVDDNMQ